MILPIITEVDSGWRLAQKKDNGNSRTRLIGLLARRLSPRLESEGSEANEKRPACLVGNNRYGVVRTYAVSPATVVWGQPSRGLVNPVA